LLFISLSSQSGNLDTPSYTSTPPIRLHGVVLKQARDTSSWLRA